MSPRAPVPLARSSQRISYAARALVTHPVVTCSPRPLLAERALARTAGAPRSLSTRPGAPCKIRSSEKRERGLSRDRLLNPENARGPALGHWRLRFRRPRRSRVHPPPSRAPGSASHTVGTGPDHNLPIDFVRIFRRLPSRRLCRVPRAAREPRASKNHATDG